MLRTLFILALPFTLVPNSASAAMTPDQFKREAQEWTMKAQEFVRLDCAEMESIWTAGCGSDIEPSESADRLKMIETAKSIGVKVSQKAKDLDKEYGALDVWRDDFLKMSGVLPKDLDPIVKAMDDQKDRVKKASEGAVKGANHPMVQHAIEYGKQQHKKMEGESRHACEVRDESFPGSAERPDCVSGSQCIIYEFKPDNAKAKAKGETQLKGYKSSVEKYYQASMDRRQTPDSKHGGKAMMGKIVAKCLQNGKVVFKTKISAYQMCQMKYQCQR